MTAIWTRVSSVLLALVLLALLAVIAMLATDARGGPLDPAASPASTDGIREPGTPISLLPFATNGPGRYYLTRDLTGASGVTIQHSDVTLDLHGFTLRGPGGSGNGILVSGEQTAVRIQNGTVRGWFNGIDAQTATHSHISNVIVLDNGGVSLDSSIGLAVGGHSIVEGCNVAGNAATGLYVVDAIVRGCLVAGSGNDGVLAVGGSLLQQNRFVDNATAGAFWFDLRLIGDNTVTDNALGRVARDTNGLLVDYNNVLRNTVCVSEHVGDGSLAGNFEVGTSGSHVEGLNFFNC